MVIEIAILELNINVVERDQSIYFDITPSPTTTKATSY